MKITAYKKSKVALITLSCVAGIVGLVTAYKEVITTDCGGEDSRKNAARDGSTNTAIAQSECSQTDENDYLFVGCNGFF
ncbi:MAG: hypothetical protein ACD_81C00020G0002 [uncultured bacterium]|uniref:Uncharacterized protein n=2 Tax=Candidatus Wolfeibacteriota TaxID=1752735 RepID=A0A0G1H9F0_9BACT|nr:MAG: hypothetical protein ACD_81C00020G0002 [uncultured bacterium]KKR12462.1 MAG: hypothetical protein UT41_C0001G0006 [Candidatus Wolfebacteria bacterium GW2011_GWC2_39_22]KKT43415.1 MAG: hypothetical protein UW32_C0001G0007 [Candidatus Wolfebacteria bacterium GW2011_GWE2_44_13]HBI25858.1 hypothetical protein [Candidatus Wolfebacteria bacterium]